MHKASAVGVLHIENDFIVLLLVTSVSRTVQAFIAVNDDSDTFAVVPDFAEMVNLGLIRLLRAKDLTPAQKQKLRQNFLEKQIDTIEANYQPFELAVNKTVGGRLIFSLFGKGWGPGWKATARAAVTRFRDDTNYAFQYLSEHHQSLKTAYLGVLYLATKHGLDQYSQAENEYWGTKALLDGSGAKVLNPMEGKQWLIR